ncbi:hypothetical protein G3T14_23465 [Methylobacterium sp. BTF04]|nr:hypothetical protein [Methylobacterium sp. BTF04]NEU15006.1 hypothetical protein [Methylobacterium sp. BTF04]
MQAVAAGAKVDAANRLFVDEHWATSIRGRFVAGGLACSLNQNAIADG